MAEAVESKPPGLPVNYKPIFGRLTHIWSSSEYSDLKVTCNGWEWAVHRAIVCPASAPLAACCTNFKEASTGVIDLPDDDRDVVNAMLTYIYSADYDDSVSTSDSSAPKDILFDVHVHTIGDKYGILDLCKLAEAKFAVRARKEWKSTNFAKSIEEMYTTAPESKRDMQKEAVEVVISHAKELFDADDKSRFASMSSTTPAFVYDVCTELMAKRRRLPEGEVRFKCLSCNYEFTCEPMQATFETSPFTLQSYIWCPRGCGEQAISEYQQIYED